MARMRSSFWVALDATAIWISRSTVLELDIATADDVANSTNLVASAWLARQR